MAFNIVPCIIRLVYFLIFNKYDSPYVYIEKDDDENAKTALG